MVTGVSLIIIGAMGITIYARRTEIGILDEYVSRLQAAYARATTLAQTDDLTGLPNRRHFYDLLESQLQASASSGDLHVVFLDIDHFKDFNERFGHAIGDEVLRQAATHFRNLVPGNGTVARVGGDEFAAFVAGVSRSQVIQLARAHSHFRPNGDLAKIDAEVTASYGVASFGRHGMHIDDIMAEADHDMFRRRRRRRQTAA